MYFKFFKKYIKPRRPEVFPDAAGLLYRFLAQSSIREMSWGGVMSVIS